MSIANTAVLIAALMPALTMGIAKASAAGKKPRDGGYDNRDPRGFMQKLSGWQARAAAAQNNGFEALPLFAFAVLAAQFAGVDQARTDHLALAFIAVRVIYTGLYIGNIATLRTIVWAVGLGISIAIVSPTLSALF